MSSQLYITQQGTVINYLVLWHTNIILRHFKDCIVRTTFAQEETLQLSKYMCVYTVYINFHNNPTTYKLQEKKKDGESNRKVGKDQRMRNRIRFPGTDWV